MMVTLASNMGLSYTWGTFSKGIYVDLPIYPIHLNKNSNRPIPMLLRDLAGDCMHRLILFVQYFI